MVRYLLASLLLGVVAASSAVTTGVMPRTPTVVRAPVNQEPSKAAADDSSGLRKGTIESVDVVRGSFHVFGERHTFDVGKVQIFGRDGKQTSVHALHRGAPIRFMLDAADSKHRQVAVIYLE